MDYWKFRITFHADDIIGPIAEMFDANHPDRTGAESVAYKLVGDDKGVVIEFDPHQQSARVVPVAEWDRPGVFPSRAGN